MKTRSLQFIRQIAKSEPLVIQPYLLCRVLTDNGMVDGRALTGVKNRVMRRCNGGTLVCPNRDTGYAWIVMPDGRTVDPVCWLTGTEDDGYLTDGIDPARCDREDLPEHYAADEVVPVTQGAMRELYSRLLGYRRQIRGLTMPEAAWIGMRSLDEFGRYSRRVYGHFIGAGLGRLLPLKQVRQVYPKM